MRATVDALKAMRLGTSVAPGTVAAAVGGAGAGAGAAGSGAYVPHRLVRTLREAENARGTVALPSPSKTPVAGELVLMTTLCHFEMDAVPHLPALSGLAQGSKLTKLAAAASDPAALLREESLYPLTTAFVPEWVVAETRPPKLRGGDKQAVALHWCREAPLPTIPRLQLPWRCFPELLSTAQRFHPGFNGEVKSAISSSEVGAAPVRLFDEMVTYVLLDMASSLFRGVPAGCSRFFSQPPVGYGLVACAHLGYIVAIEWIGKLFVSVVSEPFFIGSEKHAAAVAALPDFNYEEMAVDLRVGDTLVATWSPSGPDAPPHVIWRHDGAEGDEFFKIIVFEGASPAQFSHMFGVYNAFAEAWKDERDPPPPSLLPARLLFGAGEVCVTMRWVPGRDATREDLAAGGCAVEAVADAIAWLARHGLMYIDLRLPNVRVAPSGDVYLIDYDDMVISKGAIPSFEDLQATLAEAGAFWAHSDHAAALPAVLQAVRARWA